MTYIGNKDKSYCKLAVAIIKSAVIAGDVEFFESNWGYNLVELANFATPLSLTNLKELAKNNRNLVKG